MIQGKKNTARWILQGHSAGPASQAWRCQSEARALLTLKVEPALPSWLLSTALFGHRSKANTEV